MIKKHSIILKERADYQKGLEMVRNRRVEEIDNQFLIDMGNINSLNDAFKKEAIAKYFLLCPAHAALQSQDIGIGVTQDYRLSVMVWNRGVDDFQFLVYDIDELMDNNRLVEINPN